MCKKTEGVTCTSKHTVDEMWKQWHMKSGKECGKENSDDEEEVSQAKADDKTKARRRKGIRIRKRRHAHATTTV